MDEKIGVSSIKVLVLSKILARMAGEINAATLNTLHNLNFYLDSLKRIREAIEFGQFESLRVEYVRRRG